MGITISIYIAQIFEIVTLVVGFYTFKSLPKTLKLLVLSISISTFFDITMYTISDLFKSNYFAIHIYTIIDFIIILFILLSISTIKNKQYFFILISLIFLIFWVIMKFKFEPFNQMDNFTSPIAKGFITLFSTHLLLKRAMSIDIPILRDGISLLLIAFLIYYGGSLFVIALSNLFLPLGIIGANIWRIHTLLHIVFDSICIFTFLLYEKIEPSISKYDN